MFSVAPPHLCCCRHIQAHASSCSESGMAGSTIRQSFCSALQAEVAEFYRLMAVLQEQSMREAPKPSSLSSGTQLLSFPYPCWDVTRHSHRRAVRPTCPALPWCPGAYLLHNSIAKVGDGNLTEVRHELATLAAKCCQLFCLPVTSDSSILLHHLQTCCFVHSGAVVRA